jgi:hypothetical protein
MSLMGRPYEVAVMGPRISIRAANRWGRPAIWLVMPLWGLSLCLMIPRQAGPGRPYTQPLFRRTIFASPFVKSSILTRHDALVSK